MRQHLIALPHVRLGTEWTGLCAYSNKIQKYLKMMKDHYEILLYAPESDPIPGAEDIEVIPCLPDSQRTATFGPDDPNNLPLWPTDEQFAPFNLAVIDALKKRVEGDDIILLGAGWSHKAISDAFPNNFRCEPHIGQEGILFGNVFGAYESHTHMAAMYQRYGIQDVRWFDRVIYPFYDPEDLPLLNKGKGDYLLYIGRLIYRKGVHIAAQIADAVNMPLVVAGPGASEWSKTRIWSPNHVEVLGKELIYVGPVGVKKRAELIANAVAQLAPTTYRGPGENVCIEAMGEGTPCITTDFGVFGEIVPKEFRFHNLKDACVAVERAKAVNHKKLQKYARENFSLAATAPKFKEWFESIATLKGKGWYTV